VPTVSGGNVQISTAQSKFDGASAAFDGNGDYLYYTNANTAFGTGGFTVECWVYLNQLKDQSIYDTATLNDAGSWTRTSGFLWYIKSDGRLEMFMDSGNMYPSTTVLSTGQWYHLALTRNASTGVWNYYINGQKDATQFANAKAITSTNASIGFIANASDYYLNGYIDELRVAAACRYTSSFSAPTAPFPDIGPSYDADAATYFAAVEAADGQSLESVVKIAINDFIVGCKADGTWSALKASCILAGARTLAGALVPLVGTAPTNFNFVSADYNRKTGLVGNAASKYLNTQRSDSADPQNSHHLAVYASAIASGNQSYCGLYGDGNGSLVQRDSNKHYAYSRSSGPAPSGASASNLNTGLLGGVRTSSTSLAARFGGTNYTEANSSTATKARNVYIFGRNDSSGFVDATSARLAFYSIGEAIDLALLDTRLTTLMSALATAIP
jgi:hypothetical protein